MQKRSTSRSKSIDPRTAPRPAGRGWVLLGALVALTGVVIGAETWLPAPAKEVVASARGLGFDAALLLVGGLAIVAIGAAADALSRRALQPKDDSLIFEQVANDLLVVKDALDQANDASQRVHDEVRMVQSGVSSLSESQHAFHQHLLQAQPQAQPGASEDAIYRLAASLDQLGARMEQRMKAQYGEMQTSLDELNAVVASVRRNVDDLFHGVQAAAAPVQAAEPQPFAVHGDPPAALPTSEVEPAGHGVPLGLLDQLDDPLAPLEVAAPAPAAELAAGYDERAPAPVEPALASIDEVDMKLAELRALLSDERLRAALEAMRRVE